MKYFFNLRSDDGDDLDEEGVDFASLHEAKEEARRAAREIIADLVVHEKEIDGKTFEIADEHGEVVATVAFRDLLKL